MSNSRPIEVNLPDKAVLLVQAVEIGRGSDESLPVNGGVRPADVGLADFFSFTHVTDAIKGLATQLHGALQAAQPDVVTIELGFDLAVKGSQVLALLAEAGTHASVNVRLEWHRDDSQAAKPDDSSQRASAAEPA